MKKLIIKNIGIISDIELEINKPLIIFFGEIKSGKTTILNAIRLLFGGSYPDDIIRHGEEYAFVHLFLDNNTSIRREFYLKDGHAVSRQIQYIKDGQLVKNPVTEIKKLVNPFLLNQNFFAEKNSIEKARYLVELFGLDTSEIDSKIKNIEERNKEIRIQIKAYGEIDVLNEVEEPQPINDLLEKKQSIDEYNSQVRMREIEIERKKIELDEIKRQLAVLELKKSNIEKWLIENQNLDLIDSSEIDKKIQSYEANKMLYMQYLQNKRKQEDKNKIEKELRENETLLRNWRIDKLKKLSELNNQINIQGFQFTEDGSFLYENTTPEMLSTAQIMELSSKLSSLYPNELGLELIDRGESLGKSIYEYIEKAEKEELSILSTIVGEKPAIVPENIGVFVVENGKIKQ